MPDTPPDGYLQTKYAFIDTEAFRREMFDWQGKRLSKLLELIKARQLVLLTTEITKREIKKQIRQLLVEAQKSLGRNRVVLEHLGHKETVAAVNDASAAKRLEAVFEQFLTDAKTIEVPITATISGLFDDYFERRPPFGEAKKSEFPDAAVITSLRDWCKKRKATAYVVSKDSDLVACCVEGSEFLSSESIGDLVTTAMVSKEFYDALFESIAKDEYLCGALADQVKEEGVDTARRGGLDRNTNVTVEVENVENVNIFNLDIVERADQRLACEAEFEADVILHLDIESHEWNEDWYDQRGYWHPRRYNRRQTISRVFYAEVVVLAFDAKDPDAIEYESIYVSSGPIDLKSDEIPKPHDS